MPTYRATVRIEGLQGDDPREIRHALQVKLSKGEFSDCRILSVEQAGQRQRGAERYAPRVAPGEGAWRRQSNAAGIILLLVLGWAAWFFWSFLKLYLATD